MGKVRYFKFDVQIDREVYEIRSPKLDENGYGLCHAAYF